MNDKTKFESMLEQMCELQTPIITVEGLDEDWYDSLAYTSHIIVPDGMDKVTDFTFIRCRQDYDCLVRIHSLEMSFSDAIIEFSKKTIHSLGAVMKIHSN